MRNEQGLLLAWLVFGSAPGKCQSRVAHIGWTLDQSRSNLCLLTNNTRFLILPWVRVPHLKPFLESNRSLRAEEQTYRQLLADRDATIARQTQRLEELNSLTHHLR